jgi:hypothetical protein
MVYGLQPGYTLQNYESDYFFSMECSTPGASCSFKSGSFRALDFTLKCLSKFVNCTLTESLLSYHIINGRNQSQTQY